MLKRASFVTKIVGPDGKVLYQRPETGHRVLDVNVARTMVEMLKGPVRNGTASGTLGRFPRPAAGKTGTTDDHADAWFIGFTPQFTAAVWMGDPKGRTPMTNVGGIRVFGATYPARIWGQFMLDATSHLPVLDFTPPERALWPRPSYLDEFGRRLPRVTATPFVPPTSLPPGSVPPDTGGPAPVVTVPGP
jgi:penicillin-binding protein 1A